MAAYATATDFTNYTGQTATADTPRLLQRASDALDARLIGAYYAADVNGLPTDATQLQALNNATCAQVEYWLATGDELGLSEQYGIIKIGSVMLNKASRSTTSRPRAPVLCQRAIDELQRVGLWPSTPVVW